MITLSWALLDTLFDILTNFANWVIMSLFEMVYPLFQWMYDLLPEQIQSMPWDTLAIYYAHINAWAPLNEFLALLAAWASFVIGYFFVKVVLYLF